MTIHHKSLAMLFLVTLLWGLTFPLIKMSAPYVNADSFVAIRCALAAAALLPFIFTKLFSLSYQRIIQGLILGVLNGSSYVTQTLGLKTIDPASSAFITGLGIIIVPFLLPFFGMSRPRAINYFCSVLCLAGLYILTGANLHQDISGVLWTLLGALFFSFFTVYLQKIQPKENEVLLLSFYQIIGAAALASGLFIQMTPHVVLNFPSVIALLFCGIIATSLVLVLQTRYQQFVPATQVVLIYSLESLFASIFSYLLVDEHFSLRIAMGGMVMLLSIILNELYPLYCKNRCRVEAINTHAR